MQGMMSKGLLALTFAAGLASLALPASAAQLGATRAAAALAASDVTQVQWDGRRGEGYSRDYGYERPRHAFRDPGSLRYDGYGYAYNRYSGQRYQTCVFDEGYGRVRPCDAGRN